MSARGDGLLRLGEHSYGLRGSFAALAKMEQRTGRGVLVLCREMGEGTLSLADLVIIMTALVRAYEGTVPTELGEKILVAGPLRVLEVGLRTIMAALGLSAEGNGDAKAADALPPA